MNGLIIEPMTAEDLPEVMEIERLSFPRPWSTGLFLHELKLPFSRARVMRPANGSRRLIGYVIWWIVGDETHLLNLAVHPDYRRTGAGRVLLQLVLDDALACGARLISLEVSADNVAARAMYEKFGFTERRIRRDYYGKGQNAIVMDRDCRTH